MRERADLLRSLLRDATNQNVGSEIPDFSPLQKNEVEAIGKAKMTMKPGRKFQEMHAHVTGA